MGLKTLEIGDWMTASSCDGAPQVPGEDGCESQKCVEVGPIEGGVAVRDSENREGPRIEVSPAAWVAFVGGVATLSATRA
jgi:hypothetical protein